MTKITDGGILFAVARAAAFLKSKMELKGAMLCRFLNINAANAVKSLKNTLKNSTTMSNAPIAAKVPGKITAERFIPPPAQRKSTARATARPAAVASDAARSRLAERDSNHISFNGAKFVKSALNSLIIRQVLSRSFALIFLNLSPLKCEAP